MPPASFYRDSALDYAVSQCEVPNLRFCLNQGRRPVLVAGGLSNILPSAPALVAKICVGGFQRGPDICCRVPFGLFFWVLFLQEQEKYRFRFFR